MLVRNLFNNSISFIFMYLTFDNIIVLSIVSLHHWLQLYNHWLIVNFSLKVFFRSFSSSLKCWWRIVVVHRFFSFFVRVHFFFRSSFSCKSFFASKLFRNFHLKKLFTNTLIFIVNRNIVFLVWIIHEFRQAKHFYNRFLSQDDFRIVVVLIVFNKSLKSTREFEKRVFFKFFSQWINDSIVFWNVCLQLQFDIEHYRQTFVYKNFEQFKKSLRNNFFFNDITSKRSFVSILLVSISFVSNTSFKANFFFRSNVSKTTRFFRRNNDSKFRVFIVLSLTNSKIFDNFVAQISLIDSKVSRNIINSTKQTSTKQTFFEFNLFNIREIFVEKSIYDLSFDSKFSFSMSANFDSIVQTIIIVVVTTIVIQIVAQFQSQQNQNEKNQNENFQSTIRFSKNIDYFNFKYIDVNDFSNIFFIVIVDRYI